jgi:YVTN family beta-propeller protein
MMRIHSPISASLAALAALVVVGTPNRTQMQFLNIYGQLCTSDTPTISAADPAELLASISDMGHDGPQSHAPDWQEPFTTRYSPATSTAKLEVLPVSGSKVVAGQQVRTVLHLTDKASGLPVAGQSVAGWMMLQRNAQVAAEMPCKTKAELLSQGRVTTRPDVDLNASRLLVLNRDGMIAIVNPQVDFTITQMEGVIPLPGVPADWAMAQDRRSVFVSLPVYGAVAVIDTQTMQISGLIDLPKGSMPTELLPLAGGALAVFLSASESLVIAHPDGTGLSEPVPVGAAPVALAEDGSGRLFAASTSGRLTSIDISRGKLKASTELPPGEPSLAYSAWNRAIYAATTGGDSIAVFDVRTLAKRGDIATARGVFTLAMVPHDRHLLALNTANDRLMLIDTTTNSLTAEAPTAQAPVELTFSSDYAYVRGLEGDHFGVIELAELRHGRISPLNVQSASGPVVRREALSRAQMIAPYGHGALVANADEQTAYYYMEGMNTPMGTVKTYGPNVQGIMTVDRGFRETEPGVYETTAILPFAGTYDIPLVIGQNADATCFTAAALEAEVLAGTANTTALRIEPEGGVGMTANAKGNMVFRIVNAQTDEPATGLKDVRLLAFSPSGGWQARKWAVDLGDGRYSGEWTFPKAGRYGVSVEVASLDLGFADQPPVYFKVGAAEGKDIEP